MTNTQANSSSSSGNGNQTDIQIASQNFLAIRGAIIRELRAEGLTPAEQDKLIQAVGEALVERATLALMKNAPPELIIEFAEDGKDPRDPANAALFMQHIREQVPDSEQIVANAIKAGLLDYQAYLDKELASSK